ncbi:MAG: 5-formyltetrahydrofolate cyclo-ligase [Xanthomonadales bacterium]|nr:5-formyltetrahydrofolate cyclo-ligase [Xanthomonadales bacterium]NIN59475.1 5-formyltetrahydrofolate cyclo-ligase [Xanthomonadales bacterium]NIN74849.1 5-formyltetrahydrofolate cyclo-ligase [Xanthomonadales bacterium]NIO14935.1 5-formyltetrahydrofolate cyclo-ligase [Xanthomonadales bacterium]NIP11868.1 5-formyltetrahydrofolate cyclo-ligase [Xanthomonadales bacterium]
MPEPEISHSKSQLRERLRATRMLLGAAERARLDEALRAALLEGLRIVEATTVALFWPFDGEPDLVPAMHDLLHEGVTLALPVLEGNGEPGLVLRRWHAQAEMVNNHFGIPEPVFEPRIEVRALDVCCVPLVAWDPCGNRLGMGAGYYDRLLGPLRDQARPLRMGVGYALQQVEDLPAEAWDVPLHGVVTDHGWKTWAA